MEVSQPLACFTHSFMLTVLPFGVLASLLPRLLLGPLYAHTPALDPWTESRMEQPPMACPLRTRPSHLAAWVPSSHTGPSGRAGVRLSSQSQTTDVGASQGEKRPAGSWGPVLAAGISNSTHRGLSVGIPSVETQFFQEHNTPTNLLFALGSVCTETPPRPQHE